MHLRVLTYNIHRAIGLDRRFRLDRIETILRHHAADIVLLQEVDKDAPRSSELDLAHELAERTGYPHYAVGHNVSLRKGLYGNATLSRFPIARERNIDLTIGDRKRRGCQHTTLLLDGDPSGRRMEVFNLHLGLWFRERERQAGVLFRSQEFSSLTGTDPCIVAGDFNDWRALVRPFFTEVLGFGSASQIASGRDVATFPSFSPSGALDKIFYRGGLRLAHCHRCRMRVANVASDHRPLIADFEFPAVRVAGSAD